MRKKKGKHGGERPGAGRKKGEPKVSVTFRVKPENLANAREVHGKGLNAAADKWMEKLKKKA